MSQQLGRINVILDGYASILLSRIVTLTTQADGVSIAPEHLDGHANADHVRESNTTTPMVRLASPNSSECGSGDSQTAPQSQLSVFEDIHLTSRLGTRSVFILPLLCVSNDENILALIASALYQRHVLNIDVPVIGLRATPHCSIVRVVVGWMGSSVDEGLPSMHITTPTSSCGVFNLASRKETHHLAEFLFNLRAHFSSVSCAESPILLRRICWRSDHAPTDTLCERGYGGKYSSWHHHLWDPTSVEKPRVRGHTKKGRKGCLVPDIYHKSVSQCGPEFTADAQRTEQTIAPEGRFNTPSFAGHSSRSVSNDAQSNIDTWLFERRAYPICLYTGSGVCDYNDTLVLDEMFAIYNQVVSSVLPRENEGFETSSDSITPDCEPQLHGFVRCASELQAWRTVLQDISLKGTMTSSSQISHLEVIEAVVDRSREYRASRQFCGNSNTQYDGVDVRVNEQAGPFLKDLKVNYARNATRDGYTLAWQCMDAMHYSMLCCDAKWEWRKATDTLSAGTRSIEEQVEAVEDRAEKYRDELFSRSDCGGGDSFGELITELAFGSCNSAVVVPIQGFFLSQSTAANAADASKSQEVAHCIRRAFGVMHLADSADAPGTATTESIEVRRSDQSPHESVAALASDNLLLPLLVVEHADTVRQGEQHNQAFDTALNKCRMCCVSSAIFLSRLGIYGWPVFGLVTFGVKARLVAAMVSPDVLVERLKWDTFTVGPDSHSADEDRYWWGHKTYILDHGIPDYDLSNTKDAVQVAVILSRIKERGTILYEMMSQYGIEPVSNETGSRDFSTSTDRICSEAQWQLVKKRMEGVKAKLLRDGRLESLQKDPWMWTLEAQKIAVEEQPEQSVSSV
ncbi:hypothetical protein BXZ70DRAFT_1012654 [Cristinia sonorae]|uniref:Uncharacterized protein n=1 Tax=Cristinia sonorae TaxID=1940300 RepID=A0A8K0UF29_9AGAR|nr:hypothetical protein BXZ70DRAFT_1012654 [Cristinia sonorae]